MRWKHPFPYDTDPAVRLGQQIGDVLFALLVIYFVWGLFLPLLQQVLRARRQETARHDSGESVQWLSETPKLFIIGSCWLL
jgi:hypothetical protein